MSALDRAMSAWGETVPDWVQALAQECDRTNQTLVARQLSYSSAVVSNVISAKYAGNLVAVEQAVRGALMKATVHCPVVGELGADTCNTHQRAPWSPHNPQRIQFYRACRGGCAHSRIGGKADVE
jgi:hypothetical protein